MRDKLVCVNCAEEFVFDPEEQKLYEQMGFASTPKRCKACRGTGRALLSAVKPEKEMHLAICAACGKETQLPFKPKGDKPVYCKACFAARKSI